MFRAAILSLTACSVAAVYASETEKATVDFGGDKGAPRLVAPGDANIDGYTPLKEGQRIFSLSAGDRVELEVDGPRSFVGRTLEAKARKLHVIEEDDGWFVFSHTTRHEQWRNDPLNNSPTVTVGKEVQVYLVVRYHSGKKPREIVLPVTGSVSLVLDAPADVEVRLDQGANTGIIAFEDRELTDDENKTIVEPWLAGLRREPHIEHVELLRKGVNKGTLGQLRLTLQAERP